MRKKTTDTSYKVIWDGCTWFVSENKNMAEVEAHRIKNLHPQDTVYLRTIMTVLDDESIEATQMSNNENQQ